MIESSKHTQREKIMQSNTVKITSISKSLKTPHAITIYESHEWNNLIEYFTFRIAPIWFQTQSPVSGKRDMNQQMEEGHPMQEQPQGTFFQILSTASEQMHWQLDKRMKGGREKGESERDKERDRDKEREKETRERQKQSGRKERMREWKIEWVKNTKRLIYRVCKNASGEESRQWQWKWDWERIFNEGLINLVEISPWFSWL